MTGTKFRPTRPIPWEHTTEAWSLPDELLLELRHGKWVVTYEAENPPGSDRALRLVADIIDEAYPRAAV